MNIEEKEIKIEPKINLNYNIFNITYSHDLHSISA